MKITQSFLCLTDLYSNGPEGRVQRHSGPSMNRTHSAFTLIELMISIALVLLLILGVNQVFTYTTQAVGAGEAVNASIRYSRAAQSTMASDFAAIVPNGTGPNDSACMIISSRASYAFANAKDQAAQGQTDTADAPASLLNYPAAFLDFAGDGKFGNSKVNGDVVYPATYNSRHHRLDVLSFFARGLFSRQTGNPGVMVDNLSSTEAWIWYGHLHLPNGLGNNTTSNYPNNFGGQGPSSFPCDQENSNSSSNPLNYFGNQVVLGRVAMLLKRVSGGGIYDNSSPPQSQWYIPGAAGAGFLYPLSADSFVNTNAVTNTEGSPAPQPYYLPDSRVDLADTSISAFRTTLTGYSGNWWDLMMDGNQSYAYPSNSGHFARFKCDPYLLKPMTSQYMAQASPYFLGGCSQFMVEFAGDFLKQDSDASHLPKTPQTTTNYGDITAAAADGTIDFTVTYPNGPLNPPLKQVKWYGMPRGTANAADGSIGYFNGDVVPIRDWLLHAVDPLTFLPTALPQMSFEHFDAGNHGSTPLTYPSSGNYAGTGMSPQQAYTGYTCAFAPTDPHPKLIRITLTLDDPTGRLPNGQTYQYVFALP